MGERHIAIRSFDDRINAVATVERIDPTPSGELVVIDPAYKCVVTLAADERVVPCTAIEIDPPERKCRGVEDVVAASADEHCRLDTDERVIVGLVAPGERRVGQREIGICLFPQDIKAFAAVDTVRSAAAGEGVIFGSTNERVIPFAAPEINGADRESAGIEHVGGRSSEQHHPADAGQQIDGDIAAGSDRQRGVVKHHVGIRRFEDDVVSTAA